MNLVEKYGWSLGGALYIIVIAGLLMLMQHNGTLADSTAFWKAWWHKPLAQTTVGDLFAFIFLYCGVQAFFTSLRR